MKTNNLKKRQNNILIATLITLLFFMLNALLFLVIRLLKVSLIPKVILFTLLLLYTLFILPKLLLIVQNYIYILLCKKMNMIELNLSYYYKPIYLNTFCLKAHAIPIHWERTYSAKLEDDGKITIRIENYSSKEVFEEQTSDYSWFLSMFRFEK